MYIVCIPATWITTGSLYFVVHAASTNLCKYRAEIRHHHQHHIMRKCTMREYIAYASCHSYVRCIRVILVSSSFTICKTRHENREYRHMHAKIFVDCEIRIHIVLQYCIVYLYTDTYARARVERERERRGGREEEKSQRGKIKLTLIALIRVI